MNTQQLSVQPVPTPVFADNLIKVDFEAGKVDIAAEKVDIVTRRSTSIYKSNGYLKATAAQPIRDTADIKRLQEYFLSKGQLRNYTLFTIGLLFGLRAGDLLSLRIHHVLNPDGTFKTHCDLIESKTRKFNNPAITPAVRKLLADYLATRKSYTLDDPLFRSRSRDANGEYFIDISMLNKILSKASRELGMPHISSHSLRKTFVYQMLQQNPNDDTVKFACQQMLNHDSFKTTLAYCGLTQDAMDTYRAGLEEVIV